MLRSPKAMVEFLWPSLWELVSNAHLLQLWITWTVRDSGLRSCPHGVCLRVFACGVLSWWGNLPWMLTAPSARSPDLPLTCLTSLSVTSPFILWLLLIPSLTLGPASLGFQHGLRTHGSPGVLQPFGIRLGLWRQPASQTDWLRVDLSVVKGPAILKWFLWCCLSQFKIFFLVILYIIYYTHTHACKHTHICMYVSIHSVGSVPLKNPDWYTDLDL